MLYNPLARALPILGRDRFEKFKKQRRNAFAGLGFPRSRLACFINRRPRSFSIGQDLAPLFGSLVVFMARSVTGAKPFASLGLFSRWRCAVPLTSPLTASSFRFFG